MLSLLKRPVAGPPAGYAYEVTGSTPVPPPFASPSSPPPPSFRSVRVIDPACTVAPVEGDTNLDGLLSPGETWLFWCATDAPGAATSQATATGVVAVRGAPVTATAVVPVRRMALLVVPDRATVRVHDNVRYTYLVANTGRTPLLSVSVVDDQRGAVRLGQTTLAPGAGSAGSITATTQADESGTVAITIAVGTAVTADNYRVEARARAAVTVLPAIPAPPPPKPLGIDPRPLPPAPPPAPVAPAPPVAPTPPALSPPAVVDPGAPPLPAPPVSEPAASDPYSSGTPSSEPFPSTPSASDPYAGSSSDPYAGSSSDPYAGSSSDPFAGSSSDPYAGSSSDPSFDPNASGVDGSATGVEDGYANGQMLADAALADTGLNGQRPLGLGTSLIVLGSALVVWSHRRRLRAARAP